MKTNERRRRVPLLLLLLGACLFMAMACSTTGDTQPSADKLLRFAEALGDAAIQVEGTKAVLERAPHLMPLLDANKNGVLELAEVLAFQWDNPADLAAAYLIISELAKGRR